MVHVQFFSFLTFIFKVKHLILIYSHISHKWWQIEHITNAAFKWNILQVLSVGILHLISAHPEGQGQDHAQNLTENVTKMWHIWWLLHICHQIGTTICSLSWRICTSPCPILKALMPRENLYFWSLWLIPNILVDVNKKWRKYFQV